MHISTIIDTTGMGGRIVSESVADFAGIAQQLLSVR